MKLLLADDHVLFRDTLVQFIKILKPTWMVTSVSDFQNAYDYLDGDIAYDLLLLDLRMPGMNGLEGLQKTLDKHPNQLIAILSGVAEEHHVKTAMAMGARAYLPKTLSGKALIKAVDLIVGSDYKFIPMDETGTKIMPAYFDDYHDYISRYSLPSNFDQKGELVKNLTGREKQVLHYLSQGLSNKDIAQEMTIKIATVKLHVSGVCKKLNVTNRTQAAIIAHSNGLTEVAQI